MKRDVAAGRLDHILREVDEDILAGKLRGCLLSDATATSGHISIACRKRCERAPGKSIASGNEILFTRRCNSSRCSVTSGRCGLGLLTSALARRSGDLVVWFWIGTHQDYDNLVQRLR